MRFVFVFIVMIACAIGCFTSSSCPTGDLPTCPTTDAPSYANDVAPIVAAQCTPCHSPGGVEPSQQLVTYDDVSRQRGPVLDQIYGCQMPQGTSLTSADRKTFLTWLVCNAPNN